MRVAKLTLQSEPYIDKGTKIRYVPDLCFLDPYEHVEIDKTVDILTHLSNLIREGWILKSIEANRDWLLPTFNAELIQPDFVVTVRNPVSVGSDTVMVRFNPQDDIGSPQPYRCDMPILGDK